MLCQTQDWLGLVIESVLGLSDVTWSRQGPGLGGVNKVGRSVPSLSLWPVGVHVLKLPGTAPILWKQINMSVHSSVLTIPALPSPSGCPLAAGLPSLAPFQGAGIQTVSSFPRGVPYPLKQGHIFPNLGTQTVTPTKVARGSVTKHIGCSFE